MIKTSSVNLDVGSFLSRIKWTALEKQSTTLMMTMCPWRAGKPETNSRETWDQGWDQGRSGIGRGCRSSELGWWEVLLQACTEQAFTNLRVSESTEGHQNF